MRYFWWGCRGYLKLITLGSVRFKVITNSAHLSLPSLAHFRWFRIKTVFFGGVVTSISSQSLYKMINSSAVFLVCPQGQTRKDLARVVNFSLDTSWKFISVHLRQHKLCVHKENGACTRWNSISRLSPSWGHPDAYTRTCGHKYVCAKGGSDGRQCSP